MTCYGTSTIFTALITTGEQSRSKEQEARSQEPEVRKRGRQGGLRDLHTANSLGCYPVLGRNFRPSPPWGRGWTAAGVFFSRGGPGEGVARVRAAHNSPLKALGNAYYANAVPIDY